MGRVRRYCGDCESRGLNSELLAPLTLGLDHFQQRAAQWRDFPGAPNGEPMALPIARAARRQGVRVLMTGLGGDEWLEGRPEHLADLAFGGHFPAMLRRARDDWEFYSGVGRWQRYLARELMKAAAPNWMLTRRRKRRLERTGIFSEAYLKRTKLGDRLYGPKLERRGLATRAQEASFQYILSGLGAYVLESNDRDLGNSGIEERFPFYNRKLTEFCLRLPEEQRQQRFRAKWILRNAMGERLPEQVRTKEIKAEFFNFFGAVLCEPRANGRLRSLHILRSTDWLDTDRFAEWSRLPAQPSPLYAARYRPLWMALGIDLWLERILSPSKEVDERYENVT